MKNILLADDHAIIRKGVKALIDEHLPHYQVDEAAAEGDIVQHLRHREYQLILIDIQLPDIDFSKLMEWMRIVSPTTHILIFTMHSEEIYGLRCLQLGAKGYLRKTFSNEEIITAIAKVINGEKYLSARLSELLIDNYNKPHHHDTPFGILSQREMEIVIQLEKGKSLKEICDILKIQYSTVNTYKRRIFEKLNVKSVLALSRMMQTFNK